MNTYVLKLFTNLAKNYLKIINVIELEINVGLTVEFN